MIVPARGLDVSSIQDPAQMRYGDWRAAPGLCFGWRRVSIGAYDDPAAAAHRAGMAAAGYLTGPYHALRGDVPIADQARRFYGHLRADDALPPALDVERAELARADVLAFLEAWGALGGPPLAAYSNRSSWLRIVGAAPLPADLAALLPVAWVAGYPYDTPAGQPVPMDAASVARRSTPPLDKPPAQLPGYAGYDFWQHTGKGALPGYGKFLDLDVYSGTEAELRARFGRPAQPVSDPLAARVATELRAIQTATDALLARL